MILGIIHARGGSVRIPRKNIKPLGGKPLIGYMIEAALKSVYLDKVIVSTDDEEIMETATRFGADVPFKRPEEISWDCPSELVTQHAVLFFEKEGYEIDIAVTMQPTTPFVHWRDIDGCVGLLKNSSQFSSTFTAKIATERPEWMFFLDEESRQAASITTIDIKGMRGVTQHLPILVIPNGAVYATRRDVLMNNGTIIAQNAGVWLMPPERSVDIDEPIDFAFAEFLIGRGAV